VEIIVTSPWTPLEWIEAHGLEPRGVWGLPACDRHALAEGVCAFAQRLRALAGTPSSQPMIFTTACDQMRRAADAAAEETATKVFLFNLPATWKTPAARRLYHQEVKRLGRFLERLGGRAPDAAGLWSVMRDHDRRRQAERARASLEKAGRTASRGAPLALVGGPALPGQPNLCELIEAAGGTVALNAAEPGERGLLPPLPGPQTGRADPGDPFAILCDHYFDHIIDVFQRPNSRLYEWLGPRLTERRVRGLVLWVQVGCDLWRAEAMSLREAFGLPVLVLESTETGGGFAARDLNRLSAFIESLR